MALHIFKVTFFVVNQKIASYNFCIIWMSFVFPCLHRRLNQNSFFILYRFREIFGYVRIRVILRVFDLTSVLPDLIPVFTVDEASNYGPTSIFHFFDYFVWYKKNIRIGGIVGTLWPTFLYILKGLF